MKNFKVFIMILFALLIVGCAKSSEPKLKVLSVNLVNTNNNDIALKSNYSLKKMSNTLVNNEVKSNIVGYKEEIEFELVLDNTFDHQLYAIEFNITKENGEVEKRWVNGFTQTESKEAALTFSDTNSNKIRLKTTNNFNPEENLTLTITRLAYKNIGEDGNETNNAEIINGTLSIKIDLLAMVLPFGEELQTIRKVSFDHVGTDANGNDILGIIIRGLLYDVHEIKFDGITYTVINRGETLQIGSNFYVGLDNRNGKTYYNVDIPFSAFPTVNTALLNSITFKVNEQLYVKELNLTVEISIDKHY